MKRPIPSMPIALGVFQRPLWVSRGERSLGCETERDPARTRGSPEYLLSASTRSPHTQRGTIDMMGQNSESPGSFKTEHSCCTFGPPGLESVRRLYQGLHSFLNMR